MNKLNAVSHAIVVSLLICLAIGSRFWLADWPNFKPVFAIAIFLGFYCRSMLVAFIATIAIMLISDAMIGLYSAELMLAVYLSVLPAIVIGFLFSRVLTKQKTWWMKTLTMSAGFLLGSITFFLMTNSAACFLTPWYPNNLNGWGAALAAGLPFVKYTIAGDFIFGTAIFAAYFAIGAYLRSPVQERRKLSPARV